MSHAPVSVNTKVIQAGKFRRYKHFKVWDYLRHPSIMGRNILDAGKTVVGIFQSISIIKRHSPDVVFAKGGYVCLPVGFAARLLRVPVVIHDSDARPGLTNRLLARYASGIATGYPVKNYSYPTSITEYTGVPIDSKIKPVGKDTQARYKKIIGVSKDTPLVVAIGGGLGAKSINDAIIESLPKLESVGAFVYLVAGKNNIDEATEASENYRNVIVKGFISEGLVGLLSAADVVVSRASATSLQELAGLAKPSVIIPARALGDQHRNAAVYKESGAAIVLADDEIGVPGRLGKELASLLSDSDRMASLAKKLNSFARPDAAKLVAKMIIKYAKS